MRKIVPAALIAFFIFAGVRAAQELHLALERSHQNRTMADMHDVANALEVYATDMNDSYSIGPAPRTRVASSATSFNALQRVSAVDLMRALMPKYIKRFPLADGWGEPFDIRIGNYDDKGHARMYAIRSMGSDRRVDSDAYKMGRTTKFSEDIVFSDGTFFRYPEGI